MLDLLGGARLAFTTDSYVVQPLFFPGGDIGTLAVNGTVNDLAMCGARPLYLSAGFILEEGLPIDDLERVVASMRAAADAARASRSSPATPRSSTAARATASSSTPPASGVVEHGARIAPRERPARRRAILLSGDVGRHGMAIMAAREGLGFETAIESDCAPLAAPVLALLEAGVEVHCLRDLTRGGLAAALVEIAEAVAARDRASTRTRSPCARTWPAACEILGLDPLYVANEGRFVAFVGAGRRRPRARGPARVTRSRRARRRSARSRDAPSGLVTLKTRFGATRIVDMLSGEQLPRIC